MEFRTPVRAIGHSNTPFATMSDVLEDQMHSVPSTGVTNDVLAWSVEPQQREQSTPSRKKHVTTSFSASPIPTPEVPDYEGPYCDDEVTPFSPLERNELVQAYLANSISTQQLFRQLKDRCGIEPSEQLQHLTARHEEGTTIKFLELVKEITSLLESIPVRKVVKPRACAEKRRYRGIE